MDRVRGHSEPADMLRAFDANNKFALGIAPSQGLYLERVVYRSHNRQ